MPTQVDAYPPEGGGLSLGTMNFELALEIASLEDLTAYPDQLKLSKVPPAAGKRSFGVAGITTPFNPDAAAPEPPKAKGTALAATTRLHRIRRMYAPLVLSQKPALHARAYQGSAAGV